MSTRLEALELDEARKVVDVSAVRGLTNLRWLFIDADKGTQSDLSWIRDMLRLECAGLWLETKAVDWSPASPAFERSRACPKCNGRLVYQPPA